MFKNVTFVVPEDCEDAGQSILTYCLPKKIVCGWNPDHLLTSDIYNCNLPCPQLDRKYYIPFLQGDKIQFQFLFLDLTNDKANPTVDAQTMITITSHSESGLLDFNTKISRSMSAFQDGESYQIIEIDTATVAECWSLEFTYMGKTVFSQEFRPLDNCKETFTIKSVANKKDCFGYFYGEPDSYAGDLIEYDNTLRYYGGIKSTDFSVEITEVGNKRNAILRDEYTLYVSGMIPEFAKKILARQMFLNGLLEIDGVEYEHEGFTVQNLVTIGSMWKIGFRGLFIECNNKAKCN